MIHIQIETAEIRRHPTVAPDAVGIAIRAVEIIHRHEGDDGPAFARAACGVNRSNFLRHQSAVVNGNFINRPVEHDVAVVVAADAQIRGGGRDRVGTDDVGRHRLAIEIEKFGGLVIRPRNMMPYTRGQAGDDRCRHDIISRSPRLARRVEGAKQTALRESKLVAVVAGYAADFGNNAAAAAVRIVGERRQFHPGFDGESASQFETRGVGHNDRTSTAIE